MSYKALYWNIRSVATQLAYHRVRMLNIHRKFALVALMEPFQDTRQIQKYKEG